MSPYDQNISDLLVKPEDYFVQTRPEMLAFVPETSKRILEVGCASGLFGAQLKRNLKAEVWGVETNSDTASIAAEKLDHVLVGDIFQLMNDLPDSYFDSVIFNDVLEHLVDPFAVLLKVKDKLSEDGVVVCSIPNIRFFHNLKKFLLTKQWRYEDAGIMDKTHLRFFTRNSIIDMFESLGYSILKIEGINGMMSWKFSLVNMLSFGYLSDTRYLQYACVAKPGQS